MKNKYSKTQVLGLGVVVSFILLAITTYGTLETRNDIKSLTADAKAISQLRINCDQCSRAARDGQATSLCLDSNAKRSYCATGIQRPADGINCVACDTVSTTPQPSLTPQPSISPSPSISISPSIPTSATPAVLNGIYNGAIQSVKLSTSGEYRALVKITTMGTSVMSSAMYETRILNDVRIDRSVPVDTSLTPAAKQLYELFNASDSVRVWARGAVYTLQFARGDMMSASLPVRLSVSPVPSRIVGECSWCGTSCVPGPIPPNKVCPMVEPPSNAICTWNAQMQKCMSQLITR